MALSWMCACTLRAPCHKIPFSFQPLSSTPSPCPLKPFFSRALTPWDVGHQNHKLPEKKHFLKTFSRKTLTASHSCDMSVHIPLVVVEEVGRWCGRAAVSEKSFIDESIAEEATFAFWSLKWDLCQNKDLGVVWSCVQVHLEFGKGSS